MKKMLTFPILRNSNFWYIDGVKQTRITLYLRKFQTFFNSSQKTIRARNIN